MVNDEFLVGLLESVYLPYSEAATAALFSLPTKTNARLSNKFDFVFYSRLSNNFDFVFLLGVLPQGAVLASCF